jgi:hypothetical protein
MIECYAYKECKMHESRESMTQYCTCAEVYGIYPCGDILILEDLTSMLQRCCCPDRASIAHWGQTQQLPRLKESPANGRAVELPAAWDRHLWQCGKNYGTVSKLLIKQTKTTSFDSRQHALQCCFLSAVSWQCNVCPQYTCSWWACCPNYT